MWLCLGCVVAAGICGCVVAAAEGSRECVAVSGLCCGSRECVVVSGWYIPNNVIIQIRHHISNEP